MLHLTAVTSKEKDDDHNNSQETGIFVTHSPTKICSKNNYNNKLFNNCTRTLLTMCYFSLYIASTAATTNFDVLKSPPAPYECGSLDLRNDCSNIHKLSNCTAITGFLDITYLSHENVICDFSQYHFDKLREITDFLIINDVVNLTSFKNLFPNLSVIRGQRLFINYALIVSTIHDLEKMEFRSLISIPRGHVLIDACPKVCYTEKINWTRLTLSTGTNSIFLKKNTHCPEEANCSGCKRDSCWSNDVCQKFDNDSVISPMQDTSECHEQCLGGCYNHTAQGCAVCKSYTDHGTCVEKCPNDKYTSNRFLRCYTREECVAKNQYIHKNTCVDACPSDYQSNNVTGECDYCGNMDYCLKVCAARSSMEDTIYLSDIMHAEFIKGCQILNGTVLVNIRQFIDHQELVDNLKDVKEITGYLKINRSPYLTSLNFFQNLEKIHGYVLENQAYGLVIYNNKNLSQLWDVKSGFEIVNGGIYIHSNERLCNRRIRQFRENIKHDNSLDSFQRSDQEILCTPAKLNLYLQVLNHRSIKFYWPKDQTLDEVEIIYRPLQNKQQLAEKSEIDTEVCNRINWRRELIFLPDLQDNSTHYIYIVQNLQPNTRYACLVKTFNGEDDTQGARSEIKLATTQFDIPTAPKISLKSKTHDTLYIEFSIDTPKNVGSHVVDFYVLEVYDIPDEKKVLDTRDYCDEPVLIFRDSNEDYDDCCSRREKEREDEKFLSQLKKEFACSRDQITYCKQNQEFTSITERKYILKKRFEAWENSYTIRSLGRFHLYVLQLKACNHAGCSSYNMLSTRTNAFSAADKLYDFSVCKEDDVNEYRVYFSEPRLPNGYITSYALHFRYDINSDDMFTHNELVCITRLEHERNNYAYVAHFNYTFNQAAVRVHSLGYSTFMEWINITSCQKTNLAVGSKPWIIFLVLVLIAALSILLWIAYKRDYLPPLRSILPSYDGFRYLRPALFMNDDRNILVDGFDAVRFQNIPDEEREAL